jgi:UDP-N-acetylmuramate dehydrogenase
VVLPRAQLESLCRDFRGALTFDAPLADRTWLHVGGCTDAIFVPEDAPALADALRRCADAGVAVRTLGAGANLLVGDDGVDGVVVRLEGPAWRRVHLETRTGLVIAAGGTDLAKLVNQTADAGLAGLEGLIGVPATIGGAIRMNAGGRYGEIGDVVATVTMIDAVGCERHVAAGEAGFSYRETSLPAGVVVGVQFELDPGDPEALRRRLKEIMAEKSACQPLKDNTGGCAFRNPVVDGERVSAGRLIDRAGLKGASIGGAAVSERHANFITTAPGCRAADVLELMETVRCRVFEAFGVHLERELVVWERSEAQT